MDKKTKRLKSVTSDFFVFKMKVNMVKIAGAGAGSTLALPVQTWGAWWSEINLFIEFSTSFLKAMKHIGIFLSNLCMEISSWKVPVKKMLIWSLFKSVCSGYDSLKQTVCSQKNVDLILVQICLQWLWQSETDCLQSKKCWFDPCSNLFAVAMTVWNRLFAVKKMLIWSLFKSVCSGYDSLKQTVCSQKNVDLILVQICLQWLWQSETDCLQSKKCWFDPCSNLFAVAMTVWNRLFAKCLVKSLNFGTFLPVKTEVCMDGWGNWILRRKQAGTRQQVMSLCIARARDFHALGLFIIMRMVLIFSCT